MHTISGDALTTNKTQAAKLLTAAEMELFTASLPAAMKELSPARLAGKVKRARTLRDKFRDLLQRQAVATRGRTGSKAGSSGSANERTARKAEILDEVLGRLTAQLEKVQAAQVRQLARDAQAAAKAEQARARVAAKAPAKAAAKAPAKSPAQRSAAAPPSQTIKAAVKKAVAARKAAPAPAAKSSGRSAKAPATPVDSPAAGGAALGAGSPRVRAAAKSARFAAAGTRTVQAHVASAGRRTQAKRDKR